MSPALSPLPENEMIALLALQSLDPFVGPASAVALVRHFGTATNVFTQSRESLLTSGLLREKQVTSLLAGFGMREQDAASRIWRRLQAENIRVLVFNGADYPEKLLQTAVPPLLLFVRGDEAALQARPLIAVVGSRKMTDYGQRVIEAFVPEWTRAGAVIVSGLAFGIDAAAHKACLDAAQKTVAVQAVGVEAGMPRSHQALYNRVVQNGCVVSEFPFTNGRVDKTYFPRRNRIISALADAVVVVEAHEKSGALITAQYALEQNRDVFTVPASIFAATSRGCLNLIRQGAHPLTQAADLFAAMPLHFSRTARSDRSKPGATSALMQADLFSNDLERRIVELCQQNECSLDDLVDRSGGDAAAVLAATARLELLGSLHRAGSGKYGR